MAKMRDPQRDPLEVFWRYQESGERPPPDEVVESILGTIRVTTINTLYKNCEGIDIALSLIFGELSPREWIENGLWQDLFDHINLTYQALNLAQLLNDRMTTDQIWIMKDGEIALGVGLTIWSEQQLDVLPVGTVIRWQNEDETFTVGAQTAPFVWKIVGEGGEVKPDLPAIILAAPPEAEEFENIKKVWRARMEMKDPDED